jgi:hypothetical protein
MPLSKQFVVTGAVTTDYLNWNGHGSCIQTRDGAELMLFAGGEAGTEAGRTMKFDLIVNGKANAPISVHQFSVPGSSAITFTDNRAQFMPLGQDAEDNIYFVTYTTSQPLTTTQRNLNVYRISCPPQGWLRWADLTESYSSEFNEFNNDGITAGNSEVINVSENAGINLSLSPYQVVANYSGSVSPSPVHINVSRICISEHIGTDRIGVSDVMWIKGDYLLIWGYTSTTGVGSEYYMVHTIQLKSQINTGYERFYARGQYVGYVNIQNYRGDSYTSQLDDNTQFGFGEPAGAYIWGNNSQSLASDQGSHVNLWKFNYNTMRVETYASSAVGNSSNASWQQYGARYGRGQGHVIGYLGKYSGNYYFTVLGPDTDTNADANIRGYIMFTNGSNFASPASSPAIHTGWTENHAGYYARWRGSNNTNVNEAGYRYLKQLQVFPEEKILRLWQHGSSNHNGNTAGSGVWYTDITYNFGESTSITFPATGTKFSDVNYMWDRSQQMTTGINKYPKNNATNIYWQIYNGDIRTTLGSESYQDRGYWTQRYNRLGVWTKTNDDITRTAISQADVTATVIAPVANTLGQPGGVSLKFKPALRTITSGPGATYWGQATNVAGFRLSANDGTTTRYFDGTTLGNTQTTIPFYGSGITAKDVETVTVDIPGSAFTAGLTYTFKIAYVNQDGVASSYSTNPIKTIAFTAAPTALVSPTVKRIARVVTNGIEDAHVANIDNKALINKINISNPTGSSGKYSVKVGNFSLLAPVFVPNGATLQIDTSALVDAGDKIFVTGPVGGTVYITGTEGV